MAKSTEIPWLRIGAESVAIVASILVAFSIDAWWDGRQLQRAEARQLARVVAELDTNKIEIEQKLNRLEAAIDATVELVSWLGPEPENVAPEQFASMFIAMIDVGVFEIPTNALDDYLAAGRVDLAFDVGLRQAVADWYSRGDDFEDQYDLMREAHAELNDYVIDVVPALDLYGAHPSMNKSLESRFPFAQNALMSDPRFESLISYYLLRLEFLMNRGHELLERQRELRELIDSTI